MGVLLRLILAIVVGVIAAWAVGLVLAQWLADLIGLVLGLIVFLGGYGFDNRAY